MNKIQRLASVVALAVLTVSLAACGDQPPIQGQESEAPAPAAAPPSGDSGVTTAKDVFGPACAQLPQGGQPGSPDRIANTPVGGAVAANPLLTQLTVAAKKANVVDTLNKGKEITVFAPYDSAFESLKQSMGQDGYGALVADQNKLGDLLKYHVVARRYDRAGLVAAHTVTTLQGGSLQIKDAGDTVTITDNAGTTAHVLCGNIPTGNATVFVIDHVLQPVKP
ncbi:MAG TPA: fasciclin domain-containing protein [Pseudonocardia sp.]